MNATHSEKSPHSEKPAKTESEAIVPDKESVLVPQIGDHIRLAQSDGDCQEGDEGRVLDVLPNGKLIVLCTKDKDYNPKHPCRCTVKHWEPLRYKVIKKK